MLVEALLDEDGDPLASGRAAHQGPEVDGTTYLPESAGLRIGDLVPAVVTGTDCVDLIAEEIR